jgi:hypothetical protein
MTPILLVVHAAATWYLTGLVWFVQRVHYPLHGAVGEERFRGYQAEHVRRTGPVVAPAMLLELATAVGLVLDASVPRGAAWVGLVLLAGVWAATFGLQVPCHRKLEEGFDGRTWRRLVRTNWIRTALWTARALLAAGLLLG